MKGPNILAACILAAASAGASYGADININSWDKLNDNRENLNNNYILDENISPEYHITAGTWDSSTKGSWNLDGSNIELVGNYQDKGFSIQNNIDSFVFKNLNIKEFKTNSQGGVIWNGGQNGQLLSSTIKSSGAKEGGVLYNNGSMSLIDGNTFDSNFINEGNGGVIYNNSTIDNISNNTFTNNGAYDGYSKGGAIYNRGTIGNSDTSGIVDSIFENNQSLRGGGAIFNEGTIKLIASDFLNNYSADEGGGAIKNQNGIISKISSKFVGNHSEDTCGDNDLDAKGAAIYNYQNYGITSTIEEISDSEFYSNYTTDFGGAIANSGTITKISNSTFGGEDKGNHASSGGAINNQDYGYIGEITASTFSHNTAVEETDYIQGNGGAIRNYNNATIDKIADSIFSNNTAGGLKEEYRGGSGSVYGGAIYNAENSKINRIENVTFENNLVEAGDDTHAGGSNYTGYSYGGAIYNSKNSTIGDIVNTDFINNKVEGTYVYGGALYNEGVIGNLENVNFTRNTLNFNKSFYLGAGAAIYNSGTIGEISGTFTKNTISSVDTQSKFGGAIYNGGYIKAILAEFSDNGGNTYGGGAIANIGTIDEIRGDFINNSAQCIDVNNRVYGGAISNGTYYSNSTIGQIINSSFKNNYAISPTEDQYAVGGAIYSHSDLNIVSDNHEVVFSGNYTKDFSGTTPNAIFIDTFGNSNTPILTLEAKNQGSIRFDDQIDGGQYRSEIIRNGGDYKLNLTGDNTSSTIILNNNIINADTTLENINLQIGLTGDKVSDVFASEYTTLNANSGLISIIDNATANYNINKLISTDTSYGIDIDWNNLTADTFTLKDKTSSGKINIANLHIMNQSGNYIPEHTIQIIKGANGNSTSANIQLNIDDMDIRNIDVHKTYLPNVNSNTIIGDVDSEIKLGTSETLNDSLTIKGTLYNTLEYICNLETENNEKKSFNFVEDAPIYEYDNENLAVTGDLTINGHASLTNDIDFTGKTNFSVKEDASLKISNAGIINSASITNKGTLITDNTVFRNINTFTNEGNAEFSKTVFKTETDTVKNTETGTIKFTDSTVNASVENDGTIKLAGTNNINSTISGNHGILKMVDGTQNINNNISSQTIINSGAVTNIKDINHISNANNSLVMNGGIVNIPGLGLNTLSLNQLNMNNGTINIASVDVDLANKTMGRLSAPDSLAAQGGTINVNSMILLSDSKDYQTDINFADGKFASTVKTPITYVESEKYRYDVTYNTSNGNFSFTRGTGANAYSPSSLASSVATQVGGYISELATVEHSFYHIDTWGMLPQKARFTQNQANTYAISDNIGLAYQNNNNAGIWVRPYTSFETVHLKNGPDVNNISYGTLIGSDTDFINMRNGWNGVISAFAGYNGSSQSYANVNTYQNGGVLGATASFYKGNFYTGITANAGASVGEAHTAFGHDSFTMLMAGIASKSGYNFESKQGRFIVQPSLLLGYTFVNTLDYTNVSGTRMDSDPLHAIQIAPKVKFITNLENGWQPYAQAGMVWNILDKTKVTAGDMRLPQLGIGPYFEYGVGLQRRWSEDSKYTAFGQAMVRNGARNGIALSFGFKMMLGKDNDKKVSTPTEKKVLKSLSNTSTRIAYTK